MSVDQIQLAAFHANAGTRLMEQNRLGEAIRELDRAVAVCPDMPELHYNLGNAHWRATHFESAAACFERALELHPGLVEAHTNLGGMLIDWDRPADAVSHLQRAIELRPRHAEAHINLGVALRRVKSFDAAATAFEAAATLAPDSPENHANLGLVYLDLRRLDDARACFERAVALRPSWAGVYATLGSIVWEQGHIVDALAHFERALALDTDLAEAHLGAAYTLLTLGNYERGWAEHEWRWRCQAFRSWARHTSTPAWRGEPLAGKRLLVWAEQGLGDTLHFVRYAPQLAAAGADVILEVQPELERLVRGSLGGARVQVLARGTAVSEFDYQVPLMSLPHCLQTRPDTIPVEIPYLRADPWRVTTWASRLGPKRDRLRVGLAWAGNRAYINDHQRSLPPTCLDALRTVPHVEWISLQKGSEEKPELPLIDRTSELTTFSETAALMMELDLVVTVDTAVAHLAGGLGRPVWILLPHPPDWRWSLDGADAPWYPTARLFRQQQPRRWIPVVAALASELTALVTQPST